MQFRGYRIDTLHRTVTGPQGNIVRLEPKAFDLLVYFSEHPEEMLSRERLIADVWGGKFVTDDAVMVAVYALRQAFGDDARAPRFIETIRGRGYRWIATASEVEPPKPRKRLRLFAAASAALIAIGFGSLLWAVLRPLPMPSLNRTSELVQAHARGAFFLERATLPDLEKARTEFRKAIQIDDRFAEPHAALAEVCVRQIEAGTSDVAMREAEARREAARAIELAPHLALSQAALASVQFVLDRDALRAERTFRDAIALDPSLPGIRRRYSYLLGASGRFDEAMTQARIATELQPASSGAITDLAWTHLIAGRLTEAERLYRDAVRLDPADAGALLSLGYCLELRNEPDAAMQSYRRAMQIIGTPADAIARYDQAFATSGLTGVYALRLERFKSKTDTPRMMVAFFALRAGRIDEAMALLRESDQRREPGMLWLAVHPAFASLHGQREFAGLAASSFHTR